MMRYLTLSADYAQSPLRDDHIGPVVPEDIGLPKSLGDRIREWNLRYRPIIPLDPAARVGRSVSERIEALDEEGQGLVDQIANQLPDVKVRYFSEGHLRYLT